MTFSDELTPEEQLEEEEGAEYPEAFGITFTPQVTGIAIALVGIGVAGYMWLNFLQPARQEYGELVDQRDQLETQIENQPALEGQIQQLEEQIQTARSQQNEVLNLLSNEESLDTLLFDLEQTVQATNSETTTEEISEFQLERFEPLMANPEVVNDGSFGAAVNGKIKRKTYSLEVVGTFTQTRSLIRSIERLQPLLLVNNFNTQVTEQQPGEFSLEENRFLATGNPQLRSTFQLEAILPISPEELRAQEEAAAAAEEEENQENN
ncbi:type IV pilus assembly protein PilO [Halothece sp. PCC 7418]|uniref:hypothetical protein n=1 Tax=Halothece sp. (strain PCC 7418) TaxID=65093 RepID=UPI0002A07CBA|nr:hypothetical protein [Halothece sp. PCC 7418]AFZ42379.1 type IV pilus assembly protein PilO [Halothece sp. PCC 7418]